MNRDNDSGTERGPEPSLTASPESALFTSCFSRLKLLPAGLVPVAISRGVPCWYRGRRELRLAPDRSMLKAPADEFDRYYDALLAQLDPREVFAALGPGAVLLCWEKPGKPCHRRSVAEWLFAHLGVVVLEWGVPSEANAWQSPPPYHFYGASAAWRAQVKASPAPLAAPTMQQMLLFPDAASPKRRRR
jgi:hypothetical protein